ncbi:MAG: nucleotidyltransferase family protein [Acidimicrobiales bacterium]
MTEALSTAAVILAAGGGSRFAESPGAVGHKLLASWRGRPLVRWAVDTAVEAGIGPVWVVTGAIDLTGVLPPEVTVLSNLAWADGQASSLQVAVSEAEGRGLGAIVIGLADQPLLSVESWRAVAAATSPIAVATYAQRRRNPVRLGREVWGELPKTGDEGARVLIRERPDLVWEVACNGNPADIDTVEDLTRWS